MVWKVALAFISTGIDRGGHATYFLRAWVARQTVFALVPTGDPPSQSSGTLMSLRAIPPACAGTAKGRCYPRSYRGTRPRFASDTLMSLTDNTAPLGGYRASAAQPQPMQKY